MSRDLRQHLEREVANIREPEDLTPTRLAGRVIGRTGDVSLDTLLTIASDVLDSENGDEKRNSPDSNDDSTSENAPQSRDQSSGGIVHTDPSDRDENRSSHGESDGSRGSSSYRPNSWPDVDFSVPEGDIYPPELLDREQWMGRAGESGKLPFAPWSDRDHPNAGADEDARWKWGLVENYVDGETIAIAEDDPLVSTDVCSSNATSIRMLSSTATMSAAPRPGQYIQRLSLSSHISDSPILTFQYPKLGHMPTTAGNSRLRRGRRPSRSTPSPGEQTTRSPRSKSMRTSTSMLQQESTFPEHHAKWLSGTRALSRRSSKRTAIATNRRSNTTLIEISRALRNIIRAPRAPTRRPTRFGTSSQQSTDLVPATSRSRRGRPGWETWDPSYRKSVSGESVHRPPGEAVFHDHREGESFGLLGLFAAEQEIISRPWDRLAGSDWWDAIELGREHGAAIPEYESTESESGHMAVLPPAVQNLSTASSGWDWRHAARDGQRDLTIDEARDRTTAAIAAAYKRYDQTLVEALPTMGKSYGAIKAAAETDESTTFLTGRGHKEQYGQVREWCDEHGLVHYTLPSFTQDCPPATGEHGEEWADRVSEWYRRGATPKEIHKAAEYVLGRPLPCQEYEGQQCPYASKWDFDPDEYDVLIDHYSHAHKSKATGGRVVVFDEFPGGAYETVLGPELQGAISYWLATTNGVPFEDYTDLLENRDDQSRRADALLWFNERGVETDEGHVFDDASAHAAAPLAVFTLLASDDLENGFEKANLGDTRIGVFDRGQSVVTLLRPPELDYARSVVALDGTPTREMWENALGTRLNHRQVLVDEERSEYIQGALNLNIVRTTDAIKPYNSKGHINTDQDRALLAKIHERHNRRPSVITTGTAEGEYDADGILEDVAETKHYGNVLGSNEFNETRVGAVIGSNHYGDQYIKKWGAYAGEVVERNDEKGTGLSYGGFGDRVLAHMRENETLQAAMRFGRDGNGAVVYVHTNTLPEWVPFAGEGRVVQTWSDGMQQVIAAASERRKWRTTMIANHPDVDISQRQVFDHLNTLADRGVLERAVDSDDRRGYGWRDTGLHDLNQHGDVELDPISINELAEDSVAEVVRTTIYTWKFHNLPSHRGSSDRSATESRIIASEYGVTTNRPPPNDRI